MCLEPSKTPLEFWYLVDFHLRISGCYTEAEWNEPAEWNKDEHLKRHVLETFKKEHLIIEEILEELKAIKGD